MCFKASKWATTNCATKARSVPYWHAVSVWRNVRFRGVAGLWSSADGTYIYIYIYVYNMYIYMYIYMYVYIYVYIGFGFICVSTQTTKARSDPHWLLYHDTVLWYISFHYPKQSPYFCTQVLQNSQSSFHTSTVRFASQCAAYPAIPWHCTFSLPSTLGSCSSIFAPSRALPQSCFCKHAQPLGT